MRRTQGAELQWPRGCRGAWGGLPCSFILDPPYWVRPWSVALASVALGHSQGHLGGLCPAATGVLQKSGAAGHGPLRASPLSPVTDPQLKANEGTWWEAALSWERGSMPACPCPHVLGLLRLSAGSGPPARVGSCVWDTRGACSSSPSTGAPGAPTGRERASPPPAIWHCQVTGLEDAAGPPGDTALPQLGTPLATRPVHGGLGGQVLRTQLCSAHVDAELTAAGGCREGRACPGQHGRSAGAAQAVDTVERGSRSFS